jgi:hypothetical protein
MTPRRILSLTLLASACAATACSAILGIESGVLDTSADASSPDGDVDQSTSEAGSGDAPLDTTPSCVPDVAESVDDGAGVFVAGKGVGQDDTDCGDRSKPCGSVQFAINRATTIAGKTTVFVASGEYVESLKLVPGITVDGGWEIYKGVWARSCRAQPNEAVVIVAPNDSNVTVLADYSGEAALHLLTLKSKANALPGESLYGVIARGAATKLRLDDVAIVVAPGGDGPDGPTGPMGASGTGGCPPSDGGLGVPSSDAGVGADAGFFTDAGYVALSAVAVGGNGTAGLAGTPGMDGGCATCVASCSVGLLACNAPAAAASCGTGGSAGCPGQGGIGGQPGAGGGSSIGIFAIYAKVTVNGAGVQAGNGGAGGGGGSGGNGGTGSNGPTGAPGPQCTTDCVPYPSCAPISGAGTPGPGGGKGGNGGAGARGGGGAGGYSYGIYRGGDADVTLGSGATVKSGLPGASRGNGASGKAADLFP